MAFRQNKTCILRFVLASTVLAFALTSSIPAAAQPPAAILSASKPDTIAADTAPSGLAKGGDTLLVWPQNVQARLRRLCDSPMFKMSQLGLCVYDLTADSLIFARGERQQLRPASCQKILTAVAALERLGAAHQFVTSLLVDGSVSADSVLHGNVYVRGGFDPAFGYDDMRSFALSLAQRGIRRIDGRIVADVSFKDTLQKGSGWCWDDDVPRLTPLMYKRTDTFMQHFSDMLADIGIDAPTQSSEGLVPTDGSALLLASRHHTMDQILHTMMKESDNIYAEAMFYQLGAGEPYASGKRAAEQVSQLVASLGYNRSNFQVADGSGLSLYNYTTAQILADVLRYAYTRTDIYLHLYPSLPIAGIDGTLRSRMRSGAAYNNVRAKTGTVDGVTSLAGYLTTADGHLLCFAIINQGVLHARNGRAFQDSVCRALCSP